MQNNPFFERNSKARIPSEVYEEIEEIRLNYLSEIASTYMRGKEDGIKEAAEDIKIEVAKRLFEKGLSVEEVAECLQIPLKTALTLRFGIHGF